MNPVGIKSLRLLGAKPFMAPVRRSFLKTVERTLNMQLVPLETGGDKTVSDLIRQVAGERDMLLSGLEAAQIYHTVRAVSGIEGAMAELGVFRGASSRIIREAEPRKPLHLFDTFQGLPKPSSKDDGFHEGLYRSSLQDVQQYLARYSDLHFHAGLFPQTSGPVRDTRFSFVHLDVDLYQGTLSGLEFFWPRMAAGGVILSHDYSTSPGVRTAFDEFFSNTVPVIPLAHSQCLVVRLA
jgi:O-methyltransferase